MTSKRPVRNHSGRAYRLKALNLSLLFLISGNSVANPGDLTTKRVQQTKKKGKYPHKTMTASSKSTAGPTQVTPDKVIIEESYIFVLSCNMGTRKMFYNFKQSPPCQ
jgi:hypothetical protein